MGSERDVPAIVGIDVARPPDESPVPEHEDTPRAVPANCERCPPVAPAGGPIDRMRLKPADLTVGGEYEPAAARGEDDGCRNPRTMRKRRVTGECGRGEEDTEHHSDYEPTRPRGPDGSVRDAVLQVGHCGRIDDADQLQSGLLGSAEEPNPLP
jgi:hypothetical protein